VAGQAVPPQTKYARLGPDRLAYQVLGQGPPDLVLTMGAFSDVDIVWDDPQMALFLRRLAGFSRLLRFDRRGTGASDPLPPDPLPPWEAYTQELVAVMDAAGSRRAALLASGPQAGPMALFFAATRPERIAALILADATARYLVADDYPIGVRPQAAEAMITRAQELWGTEAFAGVNTPSRADDQRFLRWSARLQRAIASPRVVRTSLRALLEVDVRALLPLIQAPTLVLHHQDFQFLPVEHGRYLAEHIPDARLVELPGDVPLVWDQPDRVLNPIEEFLIGAGRSVEPTRVLATVLFTDIVGSTERPPRWVTGAGGSCWTCTMSWPAGWSSGGVGGWSRAPATGSWPPSTGPAGRSAARPLCGRSSARSASRSGRGCTLARSSCAGTTSAASLSTSPPGYWPPPARARSSSPAPSVTWSPAPRWSCRTAAADDSRVWRATGSFTAWAAADQAVSSPSQAGRLSPPWRFGGCETTSPKVRLEYF
jgi:pimeloyl-ACP methyl ester carboxylesterase